MTKRTLQMNRRRERILDAAQQLISEHGFQHLTMRSLAKASGVTVPTIYNLIGNKDAVLGAMILDGSVRFFGDVGPRTDPVAILEKNVAELLGQPAYYRPVLRTLLNGGAREEMAEIDTAYLRHLHDSLVALAEAGEIQAWVDCAILAERMLSNFYGVASEWATGLLTDAMLTASASYDASITLAGVATETSRKRYQDRAMQLQKSPMLRERTRTRARNSSRTRS